MSTLNVVEAVSNVWKWHTDDVIFCFEFIICILQIVIHDSDLLFACQPILFLVSWFCCINLAWKTAANIVTFIERHNSVTDALFKLTQPGFLMTYDFGLALIDTSSVYIELLLKRFPTSLPLYDLSTNNLLALIGTEAVCNFSIHAVVDFRFLKKCF